MKLSSLKIYLLNSTFKRKGVYFLFFAIIIAIFSLPKISSLAYFEINSSEYFSKIRRLVSLNFQPKIETMQLYVTAYTSSGDETDDTPCITANGYDLCKHNKENVVATNLLPFGTKVRFPELNPDKLYTVVDRMNERYNSRIDIWMTSKQKANNFGLQYLTVEILK